VLREVTLRTLDHWHHALSVDDGLNLVDVIGVDLLLHNGLALKDLALRRSGFMDVLLNVMDDVVVHGAMEDRLHLHHAVIPNTLLHDGR